MKREIVLDRTVSTLEKAIVLRKVIWRLPSFRLTGNNIAGFK